MKQKSLQVIDTKTFSEGYTPIKVTNLKSAKRLLSKLIYELQFKRIDSQAAKDLTYLLVSFVNIFKNYELEKRLEELESKININKKI